MQNDKKTIEHLNKILKNELTAINQYFLHSHIYRDFGLLELADRAHQDSLDEMKHADKLIARILYLKGLPNLQNLGKLRIGENTKEILEADLSLEKQAIPDLKAAINHCESQQDYVSRALLDAILTSEEEHADWLETQLSLLEKIGLKNYLQSKM